MTGSDDGPAGTDGGSDDEAVDVDADLDAVQPVSTALRSVQHGGSETDVSAGDVEEQADSEKSDGDVPEMDLGRLNEVQPVSSVLRSVQDQGEVGDTGDDGGAGTSDAGGRDDD